MLGLNGTKMVKSVLNLKPKLINFVANKDPDVVKTQFVDVLKFPAFVGLVVIDIGGKDGLFAIDAILEFLRDFAFALSGAQVRSSHQ